MYKCCECGKLFDKKPDYCDCGNDEFVCDSPKISEKKTDIKKFENTWIKDNLPSLFILFTCIVLSVIIILIKIDVPERTVQQQKKDFSAQKVNWSLFEENEIKPDKTTKIVVNQTNTLQKTPPKLKTVQSPKVVNKPQQIKKQKVQESTVKKETKHPSSNITLKGQTTQRSTNNIQQITKVDTQKILNNYKNSIAKSFYPKINFANVIGNGSCELTFRIDSNGNVLNKSFSKLSSNTTLNDAVFNGVNIVSRVEIPPTEYKGETLRLQVGFNNGNYYINVN